MYLVTVYVLPDIHCYLDGTLYNVPFFLGFWTLGWARLGPAVLS